MPTRLHMLLALCAAGCAAHGFEKADGVHLLDDHRPSGGDAADTGSLDGILDDTGLVDPIAGFGEVEMIVANCTVVSALAGERCPGCDLAWTVTLRPVDSTCSASEPRVGTFSLSYGSAYFNGEYWGAAIYSGGFVSWHTSSYTSGGSGGWQLHTGYAHY